MYVYSIPILLGGSEKVNNFYDALVKHIQSVILYTLRRWILIFEGMGFILPDFYPNVPMKRPLKWLLHLDVCRRLFLSCFIVASFIEKHCKTYAHVVQFVLRRLQC